MIEDGSSFKPAVLELGDIREGVGLFGLEVYEETGGTLLEGQGGVVMALLTPDMMCGILYLYWAERGKMSNVMDDKEGKKKECVEDAWDTEKHDFFK